MSGSDALLQGQGGSSHDEAVPRISAGPPTGEPPASGLLYDLFEQRVYNFCYRLLGSAEHAADATQEAFLAVLTGSHRRGAYDGRFRSLLFAAAREACDDVIPVHSPGGDMDGEPAPEDVDAFADPARAALLASLQNDVRAANRSLPRAQRQVLALRELEYLSYADIGAIMGTEVQVVAQLMGRARLALRDALRSS